MAGTADRRIEGASQLAIIERTTGRRLREALLEVGRHLGWDQQTVVCISETITGRPWQRCGGDDVVWVARVLLEVAAALHSESGAHAVVHADVTVVQDLPGVDGHRGA